MEDTKIPNAATIKVVKQDHTLGNLIRASVSRPLVQRTYLLTSHVSELLTIPQVLFAGYKVPHPLQPHFLLKIQTDGSITPTAALEAACNKLIVLVQSLEKKFQREFTFKDADSNVQEDAYGAAIPPNTRWGGGGDRDYLDF